MARGAVFTVFNLNDGKIVFKGYQPPADSVVSELQAIYVNESWLMYVGDNNSLEIMDRNTGAEIFSECWLLLMI
jgi:hypothetical protein